MKKQLSIILVTVAFSFTLSFVNQILAQITVTSPATGTSITQCSSYILRFTSPQNSYGSAEIYKGGVLLYIYGFNTFYPNSDNTTSLPPLQPGTDYQIKVYDYYNPTDFDWSGFFSILALPAPVATPATSMGTSQFTANWTPVSGATDYRIDVSTSSDFSSFVSGYNNLSTNSMTGGTTSKAIYSGILPGTIYYYRLRTVKGSCISINSNVITTITKPNPPILSLPTEVSNKTTPSSFVVNWNTVQSASEYWVDVSTSNSFSSYVYQDVVSYTNSYSVTGLSPNTTHYVRVRAKNSSGLSVYSSIFTVSPISVPFTTAATYVGSTGFHANWYAPSGNWYYVDLSISSTFSSFVSGYENYRVPGSENYLITSGLQPNTTYYYRVRVETLSGFSISSNVQSVLTYPSVPSATSATNVTGNSFTANWNAVSGVTEYRLDVATNSSFVAGTILSSYNNLSVVGSTNQNVASLSSNSTYYYRVRSKNASGSSTNSNIITIVTATGAPNLLPASNITNSSFRSNWQAVTGASYYKIDVSTDAAFSTCAICDQTVNALFYDVTGLSSNTTYYYRVRAVNGSGVSSVNSTDLSVITAPNAPTATIPIEIQTASPKFVATWNAVAGVTNYRIDVYLKNSGTCAINPGFIFNNVLVSGATSYSVVSTNPGPFFYRVRAENSSGLVSSNSNEIPVVVSNYTPSVNAATGITSSSFNANWNTVVNSVNYRIDVSTQSNFSSPLTEYANKTVTGTTHLVDQNVSSSTTYYYRLRSQVVFSGVCVPSGNGISTSSLGISVTTLCPGCRMQFEQEQPIVGLEEQKFGIYPNPASGSSLYVRLDQDVMDNNLKFGVFDISGRELSIPFFLTGKNLEADISSLNQGLYVISMTVNNKSVVRKFIRK